MSTKRFGTVIAMALMVALPMLAGCGSSETGDQAISAEDEEFLGYLRDVDVPGVDDAEKWLVDAGHNVCTNIEGGSNLIEEGFAAVDDFNAHVGETMWDEEDGGAFAGAAIATYCPEQLSE